MQEAPTVGMGKKEPTSHDSKVKEEDCLLGLGVELRTPQDLNDMAKRSWDSWLESRGSAPKRFSDEERIALDTRWASLQQSLQQSLTHLEKEVNLSKIKLSAIQPPLTPYRATTLSARSLANLSQASGNATIKRNFFLTSLIFPV